jgi:thiol-disulfide isomerase/thioredoxin
MNAMKKTFFLLGSLLLVCSVKSFSQEERGLKIGEKVPGISLGKFLNDPQRKTGINDFRNKLLILDFWNTRCKSCIAAMPEIDSLQKKFRDRVQFIYITWNSETDVNKLFSRVKVKKPDLPFIVEDTVFKNFFPHSGDPLHVWIDSNGYVKAITDAYNTNPETITAYLTGKDLKLPRRWDFGLDFNFPILSERNSFLFPLADSYSIWLKGVHNYSIGAGVRILKNDAADTTGLLVTNRDITTFYSIAYDNEVFDLPVNYLSLYKNNRLVMQIKDSSVYTSPVDKSKIESWLTDNLYSYESKVPAGSKTTILDKLKEELKWKFPYEAMIEKRRVKCIVLSDLSLADQQKARAKNNNLPSQLIYNKDKSVFVENTPFNSFIEQLIYANSYKDTPLVSESKFKGNLHIKLNSRLNDIGQLNKDLNQYGFKITEEEREVKMLVIRDKKE